MWWTELFETKRWESQQVDYSTFEIKAQAQTEEAKAEAKIQDTNTEITSERLTFGEETKARELKQIALKFFQYHYFIDYTEMNESL